jgi:ATP-binding cassette subfamily B (MDR/TAP) protein 1
MKLLTHYFLLLLLRSLGQAAPSLTAFIRAKAAAYPIFEMIERDTMSKASSRMGQKLDKVEGCIQFKNVSFSYPSRPDVVVFNNLCLDIPSGKIVALVGGSGSGKSTVVSLIERFYEPLSGEILLDGYNIRELDLKWLRQQIGLVNQEPALFATSIRENILYGKDDATLDEITRAAKLSEALSFINNLPERFETQVLASFIAIVNDGDTKTRMQVDYGKPETNKILYDLL